MHLNTTPAAPARLPNMVELDQLISPQGPLPKHIVPLLPLKQLRRRAAEIEATHPQYREELPLVLAYETSRRRRFTSGLMPRPISLTDAATGKCVRVDAFRPGDALVQPILGYCYTTENNWMVYVAGGMSPHLRTAVQEGHTDQEVLLVAGIQEITLPDHRREFILQKAA